ncbi:hypothetical protein [Paenibacillus roseipurpureus]|uniref:Pectate lyase superfamily protein domain-containing protein n=1 Tax=Paenibacillus roseopurpureus TaxID=2918901 RepID=A0AA96RM00_9BACL|nr:hypothetical protein [Paenibacillus sp. MBLB1832]WNR45949.1 hypothetical protein MJB10_07580 [Paenibacillus sp. MBLB1832]
MQTFIDAATYGFSPEATGLKNAEALQQALDEGGTITVSRPGTYKLARTVYIGSYTTLVFGNQVFVHKTDEEGPFSHVILNKGALTKIYDEHITIENLHIHVNGMDVRTFSDVFGLHGQLAFFYVKDLRIERFRCMDLGKMQYGIQICTFEDLHIRDVIIKGDKDGVHLGRGKRFHIINGIFETYDDAVALNAHDYDVGNPELGWIEDGVVENCHDLARSFTNNDGVGYFCRILAGAWRDWEPEMKVQKSDTVVSKGRLYRVKACPDAAVYVSYTQPVHKQGIVELDGIQWAMIQEDVTYTAGVRNVTFRDIYLRKARIGFSIHFDNDRFSRSYYPGSPVPGQEQLVFENIRVLHDHKVPFLSANTPIDRITLLHCSFRNSPITIHGNGAMEDYRPTFISVIGCIFNHEGTLEWIENSVANKRIKVKAYASVKMNDAATLQIVPGPGMIEVDLDIY